LIDLELKEVNGLMVKEMDPMVAVSNVYKVLKENDKMRVAEVVFKPGEVAKMHHHPDSVMYVLKGGKLSVTSGGKTQEMELKAGDVNFSDPVDHEAKNIGNTTVNFILIELKK
jgi:quercetin dioxygenase-like cupin family protein